MRAALLIVLSLSALAYAGPAFNKNANNQVFKQQQQQYMTSGNNDQTKIVESLKQWCFSSQMSQTELTGAFKKLVTLVKSTPLDQETESAVMGERICQGAIVQKSSQSGETLGKTGADAQSHELVKDVYMDSLIACESRECMQQLLKIVNSNKVDSIRASYYMTRLAVTEKESIKDESEVKQLVESFVSSQPQSEAVERQKLFAVTSVLGKQLKGKQTEQEITGEFKQMAEQVTKTIVERYIKPVSQQEVEQYQQEQQSPEIVKKIAKRNAALKALTNLPGYVIKSCGQVEQELIKIAECKDEISSARQSAIECLEQNEQAESILKQICFDQEEPIEVRVGAYRALMTIAYGWQLRDETYKQQQMAVQMLEQIVKHCEESRNQQQDDQFVLYVISHLDNLRTSQQPEHQIIKETIQKNKQLFMQIQLLNKKFKQQLSQIRKSSRNYKLEQAYSPIDSGLIFEGDIIYESINNKKQQASILPKVVRFNMSMPVMGETVNVVELTVRQNKMDEELLSALKIAQKASFSSETIGKVVDSFKSSTGKQVEGAAEADLSVKVNGVCILYVCTDDFKATGISTRNKRDIHSASGISSLSQLVDELVQHLKREPLAFNRGINVNLDECLAKLLDVKASLMAGLRVEARASGQSSDDFEIAAQIEPRFALEAIVGPAKVSTKKLLQRFSTKTAFGLRLRYKENEIVDIQIDLPMTNMDLFTFESQLVERSTSTGNFQYLPDSIYGQEDIYGPEEELMSARGHLFADSADFTSSYLNQGVRKMKRSIFDTKSSSTFSVVKQMMQGKQRTFAHSIETPEEIARATGLRGNLRFLVSPKDMSFFVQAGCQKVEPSMQGYRVQVQRSQRGVDQKQFIVTLSTPGSRTDRTMQVRVIAQQNNQRTLVKSDVQSSRLAANMQLELIHDDRQYAVKVEMASSRGKQWRHQFECGVQRNQQSQAGRLALTYKPYLSVQSTELRRPVQLQGVLSYQQQSPKSVISYELKSPTSGDFVQGKLIFEQRSASKRAFGQVRRSLQSPIMVLIAQSDVTMTGEFVCQIGQHAVKTHQMVDWSASKLDLHADLNCMHKDIRKGVEQQLNGNLMLSEQHQMLTVERRCPQQNREDFKLVLDSQIKPEGSQGGQHQLGAELRYAGNNQQVAYKHKIDYSNPSSKRMQLGYQLELIVSAKKINEKCQGRVEVSTEPSMKVVRAQMTSGARSGQLNVEYSSPIEHQIELVFQGEQYQHRSSVRATKPGQFDVQSNTQKRNEKICQLSCQVSPIKGQVVFVFELPSEQTHVACDLKLKSGEQSSIAVQTGRYACKSEFVFYQISGKNKFVDSFVPSWMRPIWANQYRLKGDLKDQIKQEAYFMDSAWNGFEQQQPLSYFRFDSPAMRSDIEYLPRDSSARLAAFARSKRSVGTSHAFDTTSSFLNQAFEGQQDKMDLSNKLWMIRSMISSPKVAESIKQQARRFLFDYADRRGQHKHSVQWNPVEDRLNFSFEKQPSTDYRTGKLFAPMRLTGDLNTKLYNSQRPSSLSLSNQWADLDFTAQPFNGEEAYARLSALSRNRRSTFNKHDSEISYKKQHGYKAYMKHEDADKKHHSIQFESDPSPKNWAKINYDSDKLGKGKWEHEWRKHQTTGKSGHRTYANKVNFEGQSADGKMSHATDFQWAEPALWGGIRYRRDIGSSQRYTTLDYLKHCNGRLQSQMSKDQSQLYNVDFDYQPQDSRASLNVNMPSDMLHSSSFEYEPTEGTYKVQSRLLNERTKVPSYQLSAYTKPMFADQDREQEQELFKAIFGQPMKVDYSDKFGHQARFDYDLSPSDRTTGSGNYAGLRKKRASVYYKDESSDIEHQSNLDFHPQSFFGGIRYGADNKHYESGKGQDFALKTQTKYGPVRVEIESDDRTCMVELESPALNGKLTSETSTGSRQLVKLVLNNKNQSVQLAKVLRKTPVLGEIELLRKIAKKIDQGNFEHITEMVLAELPTQFEACKVIVQLKSVTSCDKRPVVVIDGEFNPQQNKAHFKIDGPRVDGEMVVDLANNSFTLAFEVDEKRTMQHYTRMVRVSDKFYTLESTTSYKKQPLAKVSGKISSMIFNEPEHMFSSSRLSQNHNGHTSTLDAVVFVPRPIDISAVYDCDNKEARITFKDQKDKQIQETRVRFDDRTESIIFDARLNSQYGQVYNSQAKLSLPAITKPSKCTKQSCAFEANYTDATGVWSAKYSPKQPFAFNIPYGSGRVNLVRGY